MTPVSITDGSGQPIAATGPAGPATGLDISALNAASDYMLELECIALSAAGGQARARVVIEQSVNAFAASVPICEVTFNGPVTAGASVKQTWLANRIPGLILGTAGAKIRANVVELDGSTPSLTLRAALWN